ncbi:hypothetical protein HDV05_006873 [Chytridiales sp. JEL 0842]|nr:hypothetical protein HDV05_006873 [Chytridiales sp. JEL 0842]
MADSATVLADVVASPAPPSIKALLNEVEAISTSSLAGDKEPLAMKSLAKTDGKVSPAAEPSTVDQPLMPTIDVPSTSIEATPSLPSSPYTHRTYPPPTLSEKLMSWVRFTLFIALIVLPCFSLLVMFLPSPLLLLHSHSLYRSYSRLMGSLWGSVVVITIYVLCPGTTLVLSGDFDKIDQWGKAVVMANHQIYPDWMYLWALAWHNNLAGDIRILLMQIIAYVPILGQGLWFFEFIFLKQKWSIDKDVITKSLKQALKDPYPLWLLVFPEGTLNTPHNVEKSKRYSTKMNHPHPKHTLSPKVTGLYHCCSSLSPDVTTLLDLTVGYSGLEPSEIPYEVYLPQQVLFWNRYPTQVHIHINAHDLRDIPGIQNTYAPLPPTQKKDEGFEKIDEALETGKNTELFGDWLREVFLEKGERMSCFYETGSFKSFELQKDSKAPFRRKKVVLVPEMKDWVGLLGTWFFMHRLLVLYWWGLGWGLSFLGRTVGVV